MVVPRFKESICKVQIPTFFRIINSLRRTHVRINYFWILFFIKCKSSHKNRIFAD
ncbi:hypothetical protein LEP1GSC124_3580 [Leptospira interrogans serovar Pyrogenes str. 200701872]|uniref:Uncharacterized protein n=1 Tax=Leptospira interrogans serovar Pyrogenes str. 200701872 TaxID=1193029 RepID=M6ZSD3_LEPIR|nr:hypothetical protein LEP1GSC124_3580 [Leptospira interrogans serovar Pyrogenes str. 200701872]